MSEQYEYYTFTKDVKTLIQHVQEQAIDHSVVEAANRLNLASKKGLRDYGIPVTPIEDNKTFMPKCYSGLNWKDAEGLIGKTVECSNNPDYGWKAGQFKITMAHKNGHHFGVNVAGQTEFFTYIRTCEEPYKHPTINIGGIALPMPEPFALAYGTKYWIFPYPAHRKLFLSLHWSCAPSDIDALQAGQVHLTEDRAQAWADWWKKEVIAKINEIDS